VIWWAAALSAADCCDTWLRAITYLLWNISLKKQIERWKIGTREIICVKVTLVNECRKQVFSVVGKQLKSGCQCKILGKTMENGRQMDC
jgi:hypothetical protein